MKTLPKQWWQTAPGSLVAAVLILTSTAGLVGYLLQGPEPGKAILVVIVGWLLFLAGVVRLAAAWDLRE